MKRIVYHYVVMRTLEVPDECPSDSIFNIINWVWGNDKSTEDYRVKESTRDCEIVDVEENI